MKSNTVFVSAAKSMRASEVGMTCPCVHSPNRLSGLSRFYEIGADLRGDVAGELDGEFVAINGLHRPVAKHGVENLVAHRVLAHARSGR